MLLAACSATIQKGSTTHTQELSSCPPLPNHSGTCCTPYLVTLASSWHSTAALSLLPTSSRHHTPHRHGTAHKHCPHKHPEPSWSNISITSDLEPSPHNHMPNPLTPTNQGSHKQIPQHHHGALPPHRNLQATQPPHPAHESKQPRILHTHFVGIWSHHYMPGSNVHRLPATATRHISTATALSQPVHACHACAHQRPLLNTSLGWWLCSGIRQATTHTLRCSHQSQALTHVHTHCPLH